MQWFLRVFNFGSSLRAVGGPDDVLTFPASIFGTQVLVEGANAALLDIDFGTYPFVALLI